MAIDASRLPVIREAYIAYTPPFDVAAVVRELLSYVPDEYRRGLSCVLLQDASGLSRRERRRSIPSQGKRHRAGGCLGLYCRPYRGQPAHIVLHVDRIIRCAPRLEWSVSFYRDSHLAWVLYHEIGHHIHRAFRPEHREPESVANAWAQRLRSTMLQQKYSRLTPEGWKRLKEVAAKLTRRRRR